MIRHASVWLFVAALLVWASSEASAQRFRRNVVGTGVPQAAATQQSYNYTPAYNESWGKNYNSQDWNRFYHYPYIYYPHNFYPAEYFRSSESMYNRYPPEMRIPIYNKKYFNYYKEPKTHHQGFHYIIDIF
ncbi:MAG: calmodulin-binding protein [Planctomycetia bacterium]|nr:calmodulin-binding protein [Planctomycetia bacterium]